MYARFHSIMVPDDYGYKLKISALCVKILAVLLVLSAFQGCSATEGKLALFLEKPRIEKAVEKVLGERKKITKDLGGNAGTLEYTEEIINSL